MASSLPDGSDVFGGGGESESPRNPRNDDGLPKSFDVLIVGTGLTESIVSAAVSRNGHSVLHIDPRDYYGGVWATFPFDQWTSGGFLEVPVEAVDNVNVSVGEQNGTIQWQENIRGFEQNWYFSEERMKEELMKQKRRFNIDVMPKLLAGREDIIQLLITSNVSRYLEFLRISKLLTNLPSPNEGVIEAIPLSRADIFKSKSLSLVEKRSLAKLIEAVMKPKVEDSKDVGSEGDAPYSVPDTFDELVQVNKVSEKLKHMVKSAVTFLEDGLNPDSFNEEFCGRCRLLLNSIGRYGNQTPYLWTLYGISEICQAFCRLSAVYGGIFILKRHLSKIVSSEAGYVVTTDEDEVTVKNIILGPDMQCNVEKQDKSNKERSSVDIGRGVLITKGRNMKVPDEASKTKGDGIFVYRISGLEVIEMNHNSQAVPKDYRLIQVSYPIVENKEQELNVRQFIENKLSPFLDFNHTADTNASSEPAESDTGASATPSASENTTVTSPTSIATNTDPDSNSNPYVIYGSYFIVNYNCDSVSSEVFRRNDASTVMESAIASSDISKYVEKAQSIFNTLYPDEEFLPKAPDCDENTTEMNSDDEIVEEAPTNQANNENPGIIEDDNVSTDDNAPASNPPSAIES